MSIHYKFNIISNGQYEFKTLQSSLTFSPTFTFIMDNIQIIDFKIKMYFLLINMQNAEYCYKSD